MKKFLNLKLIKNMKLITLFLLAFSTINLCAELNHWEVKTLEGVIPEDIPQQIPGVHYLSNVSEQILINPVKVDFNEKLGIFALIRITYAGSTEHEIINPSPENPLPARALGVSLHDIQTGELIERKTIPFPFENVNFISIENIKLFAKGREICAIIQLQRKNLEYHQIERFLYRWNITLNLIEEDLLAGHYSFLEFHLDTSNLFSANNHVFALANPNTQSININNVSTFSAMHPGNFINNVFTRNIEYLKLSSNSKFLAVIGNNSHCSACGDTIEERERKKRRMHITPGYKPIICRCGNPKNNIIKIYNNRTHNNLISLPGYLKGPIKNIDFSQDGEYFLVSSKEKLRNYNLNSLIENPETDPLFELKSNGNNFEWAIFSSDGQFILTAQSIPFCDIEPEDILKREQLIQILRILDSQTGKCLFKLIIKNPRKLNTLSGTITSPSKNIYILSLVTKAINDYSDNQIKLIANVFFTKNISIMLHDRELGLKERSTQNKIHFSDKTYELSLSEDGSIKIQNQENPEEYSIFE